MTLRRGWVPQPSFHNQIRFRTAVGCLTKIDSICMVGSSLPALVNGRGNQINTIAFAIHSVDPLRLQTVLHKCQHALTSLTKRIDEDFCYPPGIGNHNPPVWFTKYFCHLSLTPMTSILICAARQRFNTSEIV